MIRVDAINFRQGSIFLAVSAPLMVVMALGFLQISCSSESGQAIAYKETATLIIDELNEGEYTEFEFSMEGLDQQLTQSEKQRFIRGSGGIIIKMALGSYLLNFDYYQGRTLLFSTKFCGDVLQNSRNRLLPGVNRIRLNVCDEQGQLQGSIKGDDDSPVEPVSQATFSIHHAELIDHIGKAYPLISI